MAYTPTTAELRDAFRRGRLWWLGWTFQGAERALCGAGAGQPGARRAGAHRAGTGKAVACAAGAFREDSMSRHYLPLADLRLAARWIAEQASPGRIAVAVPDRQPKRRRHGRIVLLDPIPKLFPQVSP